MKLLFHAINGVGLGHVSRITGFVQAIRELEPEVKPLVVTNAREVGILDNAGIPLVRIPGHTREPGVDPVQEGRVLSSELHDQLVEAVLRSYQPSMLVVDTHFPRKLIHSADRAGIRTVLVLRKTRKEYLQSLVKSEIWHCFNQIILPHYNEELFFGDDIALWRALANDTRVTITGPIIRNFSMPNEVDFHQFRAKHDIPIDSKLVIVTAGACGHPLEAHQFIKSCDEANSLLTNLNSGLHMLIVQGPYLRKGKLSIQSKAQLIPWTPYLPELLSFSDVIVSHAGYNSIHEALKICRPLVLCPSERKNEDQYERAHWCAMNKVAILPQSRTPQAIATSILQALSHRNIIIHNQRLLPKQNSKIAAKTLLDTFGRAINITLSKDTFYAEDRYKPDSISNPKIDRKLEQPLEDFPQWLASLPNECRLFALIDVNVPTQSFRAMLAQEGWVLALCQIKGSLQQLLHLLQDSKDFMLTKPPLNIELILKCISTELAIELSALLSTLDKSHLKVQLDLAHDRLSIAKSFVEKVEASLHICRLINIEWNWSFSTKHDLEVCLAFIYTFAEERRSRGRSLIYTTVTQK